MAKPRANIPSHSKGGNKIKKFDPFSNHQEGIQERLTKKAQTTKSPDKNPVRKENHWGGVVQDALLLGSDWISGELSKSFRGHGTNQAKVLSPGTIFAVRPGFCSDRLLYVAVECVVDQRYHTTRTSFCLWSSLELPWVQGPLSSICLCFDGLGCFGETCGYPRCYS
jgi:hypothetical protein